MDVITKTASSFKQSLGQNISSNAPKGMPEDILHPAMKKSTTQKALGVDEDEEVPMSTNKATPRLRRGLKLEAELNQELGSCPARYCQQCN